MAATDVELNSVETEMASDGIYVPINSLAKTYNYNTDGTLNYVQVVYSTVTYRKSFTYTNGAMVGETAWVAQ
jgi:hypothetical protein